MDWKSFNNTTSTNNNLTTKQTPRLSEYPVWYWTFRGIISFVTITGNGLVIYLVGSRRRLRSQASPSWFILSLAVADFCVGLFNLPSSLLCRYFTRCSQTSYVVINNIMDIFMIASVTNLCLLTMDRYFAVLHPFKYLNFVNIKARLTVLITIAWIISIVKGLPYLAFRLLGANQALFYDSIIYMVLFTVLPNAITFIAYVRIIVVLRRHRTQITEQEMQVASNANVKRKHTSTNRYRSAQNVAVVAVGILNVIFLFCNVFFQYFLTCKLIKSCVVSNELRYVTFLLRYFNSAPNFFVYALAKRTFRREIKSMFSTGPTESAQNMPSNTGQLQTNNQVKTNN